MKLLLKILMIFTLLAILIGGTTSRVAAITPAITIGPDLPAAEYTKQYSQQLTADGGTEPYTFSIISGSLPTDITLSATGLVSGYPDSEGSKPGTYPFTVQVEDANLLTATRDYEFTVEKGTPDVVINTASEPYWGNLLNFYGQVWMVSGRGYSFPLSGTVAFFVDDTAVEGCGAVTEISDEYPCIGVSLNLSLGTHTVKAIYTPSEADYYNSNETTREIDVQPVYFAIQGVIFIDTNKNGIQDSEEYAYGGGWPVSLDKDCDDTVDATTTTVNYWGYYNFSEVVAGYTYCVTPQEKPGYVLTTALPEVYLDGNKLSENIGYYYPTIRLSPLSLPSANLGQEFSQVITAEGGTAPYTYTLIYGTLPAGLTLSEDGTLSGTPTQAMATTIQIAAEDATHAVGDTYFQIVVKTDGEYSFTSSSNPSTLGDAVTFTLSATGEVLDPNLGSVPPAGDVTFSSDGVEIEGCANLYLNYGNDSIGDYPATCVTSSLEAGSHLITAAVYFWNEAYNVPTLTLTQVVQTKESADLSIQKIGGQNQAKPGAWMTYSFRVFNNGPDTAQNIVVVDQLDGNTTYMSSSASWGWTCRYADSVVTCTGSSLPKGRFVNITISVFVKRTAPIGENLVNTANVTSAVYDPDRSNNEITQTALITESADLSIQKSGGQTTVKAGAMLMYNFRISNNGPDAAQNIVVVDNLDSNTTYLSATAPWGWSCGQSSSVVTCTGSILQRGRTVNIMVVVTVKRTVTIGQSLVNTAEVTSATLDPNLANNSVTQTTLVRR